MAPKKQQSATIKDVAEVAGVSVSTVSHAFSGRRPISQETRTRIFAASKTLGYVPNAHARKLRLGRSGMLGLSLSPSFDFIRTPDDGETFNRLAGSMAIESLRRGLGLVHVPDLTKAGQDIVPMDGCVVAHPRENDPAVAALDSIGIPYVLIDPDPAIDNYPWVVKIDYESGTRAVLDEVSDHGQRPVVLIKEVVRNSWNLEAVRTYEIWCKDSGVTSAVVEIDQSTRGTEYEDIITEFLSVFEPPFGIVYLPSDTTNTMIHIASQLGWRIPGDVSLAALTDTVHSRTSAPSMTGLDLAHEVASTLAITMLIDQIEGAEPPGVPVVVAPTVTARESTRLGD
ncbi:MAG: LacI family transcriptional regulator [Kocuria sp.]|nr:LacI family transcriptional regulator [Kocuria sp.]